MSKWTTLQENWGNKILQCSKQYISFTEKTQEKRWLVTGTYASKSYPDWNKEGKMIETRGKNKKDAEFMNKIINTCKCVQHSW